jgi:hypothetical protein
MFKFKRFNTCLHNGLAPIVALEVSCFHPIEPEVLFATLHHKVNFYRN